MKFLLQDLQHEPIEFSQTLAPAAISFGEDIRQNGPLNASGRADLVLEHHGPHQVVEDIRVRAHYTGKFDLLCARCLEPVAESLNGDFDLLYRPLALQTGGEEHSISTAETEIGYYQGDGLDLEDVLREQVLLALPPRVLCQAGCKGFCPHCGKNLNTASCNCEAPIMDTRWGALADIRNRVKP